MEPRAKDVIGFFRWRIESCATKETVAECARDILQSDFTLISVPCLRKEARWVELMLEHINSKDYPKPATAQFMREYDANPQGWEEPAPGIPLGWNRVLALSDDLTFSMSRKPISPTGYPLKVPLSFTIAYQTKFYGMNSFSSTVTEADATDSSGGGVDFGNGDGIDFPYFRVTRPWVFLLAMERPPEKSNFNYRVVIEVSSEITWPLQREMK